MLDVFFDENQTSLKAAAAEKIINRCMWWRAADIWILFAFHGPVAFIKNEPLHFFCSLISTLFADIFSWKASGAENKRPRALGEFTR